MSRRWRELLNDDITWKKLCDKHAYVYRRMSEGAGDFIDPFHPPAPCIQLQEKLRGLARKAIESRYHQSSLPSPNKKQEQEGRRSPPSYRSHFKRKYLIESAWNKGGRCVQRYSAQDDGVVTSLHLTPKYIVFALDNAKIHVYDRRRKTHKMLEGHLMGVWAMVPWDNILVSGGCDREIRVWDMATG